MADIETAEAAIDTEPGPVSVWEFGHFLYLFRATYAAAAERLFEGQLNPYSSAEELQYFAEKLRRELSKMDDRQVGLLARKELPMDLGIVDISRRNPFEIVFTGIAIAIAVAVIISGGTVKVGPIRVKLPPLGTGIAALRDAFGKKQLPPKRRR